MQLFRTLCLIVSVFVHSVHAAGTGRVFVTNERDNTISVINSDTLELETTVAVGDRPRGLGLSPDGSELYVAVSNENKIKVLDPVSLRILREFVSGGDPDAFAVHPNGNLYISNEDEAKASVFDPRSGELLAEIPVGLEPEGVAISPDGRRVIVTSESTNMLHVIQAADNTIEHNILIGARPRAATFTRAGNIAYATAEIGGEVAKVDLESGRVLKTAPTGGARSKPKDLLLNRDESLIYVAGGRANKVKVMDADTLELRKMIPVGERVWGLAMNRAKSRLFTTDGISGTVSVIDTNRNVVIKTIKVGKYPWGVLVDD